jgi:hypothetical protein
VVGYEYLNRRGAEEDAVKPASAITDTRPFGDSGLDAATRTVVVPVMDREARSFVKESRIQDALDQVLDILAGCFPGLRSLRLRAEDDPEIPDYRHLCLEAGVQATTDEIIEGEDAFHRLLCRRVPADARHLMILNVSVA